MAALPIWVQLLIKAIISIGSPYLIDFLKSKFKNLPQDVIDILNKLLEGLADPKTPNKAAKKAAREAFKRHCESEGTGCPIDTKK